MLLDSSRESEDFHYYLYVIPIRGISSDRKLRAKDNTLKSRYGPKSMRITVLRCFCRNQLAVKTHDDTRVFAEKMAASLKLNENMSIRIPLISSKV